MQANHESLPQLANQVAVLAMERGISLATAESCTAGLVAHLLGQTAGVSSVFLGGIVAYANQAKHDLLAVSADLLSQVGAVSEPVALAMARGARSRLGARIAVATTGVAGPGGGSVDKPVGLVFVAISTEHGELCRRCQFNGNRLENMESAAYEALRLLGYALSTTRLEPGP